MPIHDWSRVDAGLFHDFHQAWTIELRKALNRGLLPPGYIDPLAIGDPLPAHPLFLDPALYVPVPLEQTYAQTWDDYPAVVRDIVERGRAADTD